MNSLFNSTLEESFGKLTDVGVNLNRQSKFNYDGLDSYFDSEKLSIANINEQKFQKAITIDAYRDVNKITTIFTNWKKNKLLQQNTLKSNLDLEKEAAQLMTSIMYMNPQKSILKDLYHM